MMATKGMGSTIVLNVLLWIALVISIPLSGFQPIFGTVAIVGAVILALIAALVFGITRGQKQAARIVQAIGQRIPAYAATAWSRSCSRPPGRSEPWAPTGRCSSSR